jgi:MFS family permease
MSPRIVFATAAVTSLGIFPVFLLGSTASLVRGSFPIDGRQLGLAVSTFYAVAALSSVAAGVVGQRLGYVTAMRLSALATITTLVSIATWVRSWIHIIVVFVLAGAANSLSKPATNMALAWAVPIDRQGLAFGIKQSAGPTATLLAGLALPVVGLTVGWRSAFMLGAIAGLAIVFLIPSDDHSVDRKGTKGAIPPELYKSPLWVLAAAAGFATAAGSSLGAFYVESSISRGFSPALSGAMLSLGGLAGIFGRVFWGWRADRGDASGLRRVSKLLAMGATGFGGIAFIDSSVLGLLAATLVAYGIGWAWNGLFHYAVVRASPRAEAQATGIATTGLFAGGIVGPTAFGLIAQSISYTVAWSAAALSVLAAAILVEYSRLLLHRGPRNQIGAARP